MKTRGYTILGFLTWQIAKRLVKRVAKQKVGANKVKLGAAATVAGLLAAGLVAAKVASGGEE